MTTKTCAHCKLEKPLAGFSKNLQAYRARCRECVNKIARAQYASDPSIKDRTVERNKKSRGSYSEWSEEQKDRHREAKRLGRLTGAKGYKQAKHDAHVREWRRQMPSRLVLHDEHVKALVRDKAAYARWRVATDPAYRLNMRLRVQVRKALKGGKAGRRWEQLLGYGCDDLAVHLARMLPKNVTLQQALADGWHIDHIVPKSSYDLTDEADLLKAWCLSNLRLVPATVNLRKGARRETLL